MDDLVQRLHEAACDAGDVAHATAAKDAYFDERRRAERLAEALRYAVDNPEFNSETFDKMARAACATTTRRGRMDDLIEMLRTPLTSIRAPAELLEEAADALEAAREDSERLAEALREVTAVAITMLYATHCEETLAEFSTAELEQIVDVSKNLWAQGVEKIYRRAWDTALRDHDQEARNG